MTLRKVLPALAALAFLPLAAWAQQAPRDVKIKSPDGISLAATYYAAAKPGPGIVLLHMCNSRRQAWTNLATQAAARGFHVLAVDYRGYGESEGPRFDQITPQERQTLTDKWPADFDAALAYLKSQTGVDKERIGAAGGSCGVNNSVQLARRHSEVKTLVLLSGNTNAVGREYLKNSAWLPILAAASRDDGPAVEDMRWMLGWSRNPNNRFLEYQAAGHGTDMFAVEKGLEPAILDWFDKNLRNAPLTPPANSASAKPSLVEEFWTAISRPNAAIRAREMYDDARKRDPNVRLFPEGEMNAFGYQLLQEGDTKGAIEVLKLNAMAYPLSANVYDSVADAYLADGNREEALRYAEKCLQALAGDTTTPPQFKEQVRESAETKIRQLKGGSDAAKPPPQQNPPPADPSQPRGAPPPPFEQVFKMPVVYSLPGMDQAKVRRDIVYKAVDVANGKLELKFDVYAPAAAKPSDRFPAVLLISGGGTEADGPDWRTAGVYISYGQLLAASGIIGINFTKRFSRQEPVGIAEADLADLITHIREHAAEYNLDRDRLAIWGFSGGGLLLAQSLRDGPPYIRAAVSFYGVMDAMPTLPEERRAQVRERRSPLELMKLNPGNIPPVFIGRAGYDSPALNDTIDNFVKEALARNVLIEVLNHPTGRHGFDIIDDDARSREIIAAALDFLKRRLK